MLWIWWVAFWRGVEGFGEVVFGWVNRFIEELDCLAVQFGPLICSGTIWRGNHR